jgi:heat shock protein HslJ
MSTDELLDARLRAAGDRWRAAHPDAAHVDFGPAAAGAPAVPTAVPVVAAPPAPPRRRIRLWLAATAAAAATVAAALLAVHLGGSGTPDRGRPAAGGGGAIVGIDWTLRSLRHADGTPVSPAVEAALRFDGTTVQGSDGCNQLGGPARISPSQITFGPLSSTAIGCLDPNFTGAIGLIDAVLGGTVRWSVTGDELTLTREGVGTLVYRRVAHTASTEPKALVGPTWELTGIVHESGNSGSATGSSDMANTTISFDGAGHLTISHRCYVNRTAAQLGAGTLDLGTARLITAIPCPATTGQQAAQRQDGQVDDVLTGRVTWSVHDTDLTITKGSTSLQFTARQ